MSDTKKIALLFPGQGSQSVGMGRELAENFSAAHAVFDEADEALGFPLSKLIFDGPASQLDLTEYTQPAILTVSVAAHRILAPELASRGLDVAFAAGHSLGEYTAHVVAGTFSFAEALRTVRLRGQFMQEAVPAGLGGMAAILGLDLERINDICAQVSDELTAEPAHNPSSPIEQSAAALEAVADPANPASTPIEAASRISAIVAPANINSPNQTVISGEKAAVELAGQRCKEAGARRAMMLSVSAPFHCALMEPARGRLAGVLEAITFADPAFPVASNVDALLMTRGTDIRDALIRQVTGAVRWVECIRLLKTSGVTHFIEVGPGKVLASLNHQIDRDLITAHINDRASFEKTVAGL